MALSFPQPSLEIFLGFFPSPDLYLPMPDQPTIGIRALLLKCDLDSVICDPPSQTVQANP
jgi:hypothetical protein